MNKRIPVVYIAGRFRAPTPWAVEQNIRRAEEVSLLVWQAGAAAFCPHTNTRFFDKAPGCPDSIFLDGDLEILRRCDAVVMVPGWEQSKGATAERAIAVEIGMPIFELVSFGSGLPHAFALWLAEYQSSEITTPQTHCSFCARRKDVVRKLVVAPNVSICDECLVLSMEVTKMTPEKAS